MLRRRSNIMNWSIRTKLTAIFLLSVLLPAFLLLIPFSIQRRSSLLRDQNRVRLETLGPFEITRTEQTLQTLTNQLERFVADPADYADLERYLSLAPWSISPTTRAEIEQFIEAKVTRFMRSSPSITRIRFYDSEKEQLLDVAANQGQPAFVYSPPSSPETPSDEAIRSEQVGVRSTTTNVYRDSTGSPAIDIIFTLRPSWDTAGLASIIGQVVFTQNLMLAVPDAPLPDLYATLQDFPESDQTTYVFLLNAAGQIIAPEKDLPVFMDATQSKGFRVAQAGGAGVSNYYSPLAAADVMGYHETFSFPNGPQFTLLLETPLAEINREAVREGLLVLALNGFGVLVLGLTAVAAGTIIIARPIARLTEAARQITAGRLDTQLPRLSRQDEIGVLNNTFGDMAEQLFRAIRELETRVAERTRNLETTLEIGRVLTRIRDLDTLLNEVVNVIHDQFDTVYHVQVFLIDPRTRRANLRASTGAVGRKLLDRGHYLDVGSRSVIGSVTATGHAVVALDTSSNPIHKRNEFLPDTRAEMALPLRVGNRIIGALDLQSTQPDAFDERDVELFQGMADQITVAIENATLFEESNNRMQEIERLNRAITETAWLETTRQQNPQAAASAGSDAHITNQDWTALQSKALHTGQITEHIDGDTVTFAVPVILRDQVLGAVEWEVPLARYTGNTRQTAVELTTRLALTAENIRLFEQSQRAAQRELLVNQISSKLMGTTNIDQILQTAVRELGLALRAPQTEIRLIPPVDAPPGPDTDR